LGCFVAVLNVIDSDPDLVEVAEDDSSKVRLIVDNDIVGPDQERLCRRRP